MKWLMTPLQAGKPWNGQTIYEQGLGGSESAVAYLARALSRLGEEVYVLTHGTACVIDGVTYVSNDTRETLSYKDWDVVLSSRWPQVLGLEWKTKARLLWLHDMPSEPLFARANKIVCISEFQKRSYQFSDRDLALVIGDGVGEEFLEATAERNENKLIWTSNPDRGLAVAAHIFQQIRKRWPSMELHVFGRFATYGWSDEVERVYLPRFDEMENIFLHQPLPRKQLALELASSWAMFYPTIWPETFCMAALEAQACGTPVIAPPYAALPETVVGGVLQYDFLNSVSQLRNQSKWNKLSVRGFEHARNFSWESIAKQWITEARNVLAQN